MLITIDTQRIAEIMTNCVKRRRDCQANKNYSAAKFWKDEYDRFRDFLEKIGIYAYYEEETDLVRVLAEDVHLLG